MRFTTAVSALLAAASFVTAHPVIKSESAATSQVQEQESLKPWLIFSMREQPFEEASLSFTFMDPNTQYTTNCKTSLPMSGFATCDDQKTTFIYGGVSFQFGETWLSIQRPDTFDCSASTTTASPQSLEPNPGCTQRTASGHLNLPNNFWQQPGWNSWVHPESLDVHWGWAS
ncbi:hypothetical protein K461DRAFT_289774 [Myriangium duriaei CBS 260.36]|uniref:AA1-like domain-containing protein n=1 Tax=Myriangium duriaei CBS 260.36 TaxID=1168546 RepID=A0A9P4JEN0_9PEZI|nr:hypothetical protein K461DRAFT_289774 [Myriangium duriaei CBS 260.36]